jgi:hypothetical protein
MSPSYEPGAQPGLAAARIRTVRRVSSFFHYCVLFQRCNQYFSPVILVLN